MKLLFIGDIFGSPGRSIIKENLKEIIEKHQIDFVIANAENSAHGKGITKKIYDELKACQINFFTMGNHTWAKKEVLELLSSQKDLIRPINLKENFPYANIGVGTQEFIFQNKTIRITNLMGQSVLFKDFQINPFQFFEEFLTKIQVPDLHIIDFHAETTSEKNAFLRAFDGRVSAILGTHTHIATNDYHITDLNTAYISDVGMTGPFEGIIGGLVQPILNTFYNPGSRFKLDIQKGKRQFCSVIIEFDDKTNLITDFYPLILRETKLSTKAQIISLLQSN